MAFEWRSKLIARGHPRSPISRLEHGRTAKVVGRVVVRDTTLQSPIFDLKCVAYSIEAKPSGRTSPIVREQCIEEFQVEDDSGAVVVRPGSEILSLSKYRETRLGFFRGRPRQSALDFFARRNVETGGHYEYVREAALEPGGLVVLLGVVHIPTYVPRGPYGAMSVSFSTSTPLLITDDLKIGR